MRKKLISSLLILAIVISCFNIVPRNTQTVAAASKIYGPKPSSSGNVVYDLHGPLLPKTIVWPGTTISWTGRQTVSTEEHSCPCTIGRKIYSQHAGIKFKGDTSILKVRNQDFTYYVSDSTKRKEKTKKIRFAKSAVVNKGPAMIQGENGRVLVQTDIFCKYNLLLKTYYYNMAYPVSVDYLGADSFHISYDLNGGILPNGKKNETEFYFSDKNYTYTPTKPLKFGYVFEDWKMSDNLIVFGRNCELDIRCLLKDNWSSAKQVAKNGVQATAVFRPTGVKLKFKPNGGNLNNSEATTTWVASLDDINEIGDDKDYFPIPERKGYKFLGWYLNDTKIESINSIPSKYWTNTSSYDLLAKWEKTSDSEPEPEPVTPEDPEPEVPADPENPNYEEFFDIAIVIDTEHSVSLFSSEGNTGSVNGVSYDEKKNELTIKDLDVKGIITSQMGSGFTINVDGENHLEYIISNADGYNGSVNIAGNGTLFIENNSQAGITIRGDNTHSELTIADTVNLKIKTGTLAIRVEDTTNKKPICIGKKTYLSGGTIAIDSNFRPKNEDFFFTCTKNGISYMFVSFYSNTDGYIINVYSDDYSENYQYKWDGVGDPAKILEANGYTIDYTDTKVYYASVASNRVTIAPFVSGINRPGTPIIKSISTKNSKVTLSWGKVSKASGYEVRYATNTQMTGFLSYTTTKTSKTISSLKKGKTYYFKVRSYTKDKNGNKVYGSWSTVKKCIVK